MYATYMVKTKRINIRGKRWTINLQLDNEFEEQHGKETWAITYGEERTIYFRPSHIDLPTIIHELFHAYCKELFLNSANLDIDQHEEVIAEFLGDYLSELNRKANQLHKWINRV